MAEANRTLLSDDDPTKLFEPCYCPDRDIQAETNFQDCSDYLHRSFEEYIRCSNASRCHEISAIEESQILSIKQKALISSNMVYNIHRAETLNMDSINHDIPVCNVCKSLKHRKCNTLTLKQMLKDANTRDDVFQCTDHKTESSEIKQNEYSKENNKTFIENCSKKCIEKIRKIKHQIMECTESLAFDMEDRIRNTQSRIFADLDIDINAVVEISKPMQRIVNSFENLGKDITDAASVLMMKRNGNIKKQIETRDDILNQVEPASFEVIMSEITSMSNFKIKEINNSDKQQHQYQFSFQDNSSVTHKNIINAGTERVTGCAFMPDGRLAICDDYNYSVKVFSNNFKLENEMKFDSRVWDIAAVSKTKVIVTLQGANSLQVLSILDGGLVKGKCIPVGMLCWGIDCKNDRLYVSCHVRFGTGGVVNELTMDGVTVSTFTIGQGYPYYLAVNSSGNRILVSTSGYGVLCFDNTGKTLYKYVDSQLDCSRGLCFDSYDNFLVSGQFSNNIHVVKSDGTKQTIILTKDDGVHNPYCLAFRPSDNTLVVGQCPTPDSLLAFTTK